MAKLIGIVFCIFAVFNLAGCTLAVNYSDNSSEDKVIASTEGSNPEAMPFRLEILNEVNDGTELVVHGRIIAKEARDPKTVVVRLSGLDSSGHNKEVAYPLQQIIDTAQTGADTQLTPGSKTNFTLRLPSKDLSDYQLALLWGSEAARYGKNNANTAPSYLALRNIEVQSERSLTCEQLPCPLVYRISGELFNSGVSPVSKVILGVKLLPALNDETELDFPDPIQHNERRIEVRNVRIEPGGMKPIRLGIDPRALGADEEGAFRPAVRIISFETG